VNVIAERSLGDSGNRTAEKVFRSTWVGGTV
jgi:hypothetical protein